MGKLGLKNLCAVMRTHLIELEFWRSLLGQRWQAWQILWKVVYLAGLHVAQALVWMEWERTKRHLLGQAQLMCLLGTRQSHHQSLQESLLTSHWLWWRERPSPCASVCDEQAFAGTSHQGYVALESNHPHHYQMTDAISSPLPWLDQALFWQPLLAPVNTTRYIYEKRKHVLSVKDMTILLERIFTSACFNSSLQMSSREASKKFMAYRSMGVS